MGALKLVRAAAQGELPALRDLLSQPRANANESGPGGFTALHAAAVASNADKAVALLVGAGAEVDARLASVVHTNNYLQRHGWQLLRPETQALICSGSTPLHLAASEGQVAAVRALLAAGADPNAEDQMGCTPLGIISQHAHTFPELLAAAEALVVGGADCLVPLQQGPDVGSILTEARDVAFRASVVKALHSVQQGRQNRRSARLQQAQAQAPPAAQKLTLPQLGEVIEVAGQCNSAQVVAFFMDQVAAQAAEQAAGAGQAAAQAAGDNSSGTPADSDPGSDSDLDEEAADAAMAALTDTMRSVFRSRAARTFLKACFNRDDGVVRVLLDGGLFTLIAKQQLGCGLLLATCFCRVKVAQTLLAHGAPIEARSIAQAAASAGSEVSRASNSRRGQGRGRGSNESPGLHLLRLLLAHARPQIPLGEANTPVASSSCPFYTLALRAMRWSRELPHAPREPVLAAEALVAAGYRPTTFRWMEQEQEEGAVEFHWEQDPPEAPAPLQNCCPFNDLVDGGGQLAETIRLAAWQQPWTREVHPNWPPAFKAAARTLLLAHKRCEKQQQQLGLATRATAGSRGRRGRANKRQAVSAGAGAAGAADGQLVGGLGTLPSELVLQIIQQAAYPLSSWL